MKQGFVKVATACPTVMVADTVHNAKEHIRLAKEANQNGASLLVFPALSLTGATCADLFYADTLLSGATDALTAYLKATKDYPMLSFLGMPVAYQNKLYQCAVACYRGKVLGCVPKTNLPNGSTANDGRYFASPNSLPQNATVCLDGECVPFGTNVLFSCKEIPQLTVCAELGEDSFVGNTTSVSAATAGATVICGLHAAPLLVGSEAAAQTAVQSLSARTASAYLYANAGDGESTTDTVFAGQQGIWENGKPLAYAKPFSGTQLLLSEVDVHLLSYERRRQNLTVNADSSSYRTVFFSLPMTETILTRKVSPHPFIPACPKERNERCESILSIQAYGLKQRIQRAYAKKLVIGISGGLDSTLALLVCARALDLLGRPHSDILAVTMPCFGTTQRTKNNATVLCQELGTDFRCVNIFDAVNQHFADIGHDPECRDVTYENSQARERTQILMDIANECGGMVIGTGDLSELALGWATYNGDHMSMYGVNGGIPKTLIRHVVAHCGDCEDENGHKALATALRDVLDTPVSPELLPADKDGNIAQKTEDLVGPYVLHDFYLFYLLRYGFTPAKLYRLAKYALGSTYDDETLKKWLKTLLRRFFNQQFKRSCLPDGPKIGSVGLSPRGDWKMPSDATYTLWQQEAESL